MKEKDSILNIEENHNENHKINTDGHVLWIKQVFTYTHIPKHTFTCPHPRDKRHAKVNKDKPS